MLHLEPRARKVNHIPASWDFTIPASPTAAVGSSATSFLIEWAPWLFVCTLLVIWGALEAFGEVDDLLSPLFFYAAVAGAVGVRGYNHLSMRKQRFAQARQRWVAQNTQPAAL